MIETRDVGVIMDATILGVALLDILDILDRSLLSERAIGSDLAYWLAALVGGVCGAYPVWREKRRQCKK